MKRRPAHTLWLEVFRQLTAKPGISQNLLARYLQVDKGYLSRLLHDPDQLEAFMSRYPDRQRLKLLFDALEDERKLAEVVKEALAR